MKNLNKFISMIMIIGLIFGSFIITGCQVDTDNSAELVAMTLMSNATNHNSSEVIDDDSEESVDETTTDDSDKIDETTDESNKEVDNPTENTEDEDPVVNPIDTDKTEDEDPVVNPIDTDKTENDPEEPSEDPKEDEEPEDDVIVHEPVIVSLWKSSFNDTYDNRYSTAEVYTSDGELRVKVTTNNEGNEVNYDFKVDTNNITYKEFTYDIYMQYELGGIIYKRMSNLEEMMDESNYEERSAIVYPKTYEFRLVSADDSSIALCVSDHLFDVKQYAPLIDNPLPMDDCIDPASYTTFSFYKFVVDGYIKNYKKNTYKIGSQGIERLGESVGETVGGITDYIFNNYSVTLNEGDPTIFELIESMKYVTNYDIDIMEQFWDE